VEHLPHDAALVRELNPDTWLWLDPRAALQAQTINEIARLQYMMADPASRPSQFTPPYTLPGEVAEGEKIAVTGQPMTKSEADEWIAERRQHGKL